MPTGRGRGPAGVDCATATLTKWYEEHGRHEIFAGGKSVALPTTEHSLELRQGIVTVEEQQDLVRLGIARNSREEKAKARDARVAQELENRKMAELYRQHVLKQEPPAPLIQIQRRRGPEQATTGSTLG